MPNKKVEPVSREEFSQLSKSVESLASIVTNFIDKIGQPPVAPEKKEVVPEPEKPSASIVPPAWREIINKTLGPDFGVDVVYPESGTSFQLKIIVPKEKSNASQAHLDFYKVDVRSKSLSYSEGIDGVRKYCELVAKNLGIVKQNA